MPPGFVLVAVMAAGINYNNVWAAKGKPADVVAMRQRQGSDEPFHIGGSEGPASSGRSGPAYAG
ncbi:hypothetical protein NKH18_47235 [Streptomyces sp. M10(2022)]